MTSPTSSCSTAMLFSLPSSLSPCPGSTSSSKRFLTASTALLAPPRPRPPRRSQTKPVRPPARRPPSRRDPLPRPPANASGAGPGCASSPMAEPACGGVTARNRSSASSGASSAGDMQSSPTADGRRRLPELVRWRRSGATACSLDWWWCTGDAPAAAGAAALIVERGGIALSGSALAAEATRWDIAACAANEDPWADTLSERHWGTSGESQICYGHQGAQLLSRGVGRE